MSGYAKQHSQRAAFQSSVFINEDECGTNDRDHYRPDTSSPLLDAGGKSLATGLTQVLREGFTGTGSGERHLRIIGLSRRGPEVALINTR